MEKDITTSPALRHHFEEAFWTKPNSMGNKPLTMKHVLPSSIILGFGLFLSIIVFSLELLYLTKEKITANHISENNYCNQDPGITNNPDTTIKNDVNNDTIELDKFD